MDGIRAGKYIFRAAYLLVWLFILLIIAAPILGAITPQVSPRNEVGLGVNLQTIQPQLQNLLGGTTDCSAEETGIPGSNPCALTVTVPAFNNWFLSGSVALSLSLAVNGTTIYQTPKADLNLAPFQSGMVEVMMNIPLGVAAQMQGQQISGGGEMTLQEGGLWSITVSLTQG